MLFWFFLCIDIGVEREGGNQNVSREEVNTDDENPGDGDNDVEQPPDSSNQNSNAPNRDNVPSQSNPFMRPTPSQPIVSSALSRVPINQSAPIPFNPNHSIFRQQPTNPAPISSPRRGFANWSRGTQSIFAQRPRRAGGARRGGFWSNSRGLPMSRPGYAPWSRGRQSILNQPFGRGGFRPQGIERRQTQEEGDGSLRREERGNQTNQLNQVFSGEGVQVYRGEGAVRVTVQPLQSVKDWFHFY